MRDGDERRAVEELIERLVREASLPDARARDELRRELAGHFEEAGDSPDAIRDALARFGRADVVSRGFRAAYRRGRAALYAAKVLASVATASAAGLVVELIANLRIRPGAGTLAIGDGYVVSACFAVAIVIILVAAWELDIEPLCARLERRPLRLVAAFGALFATIYFGHPTVHGPISAPVTLMLAGAAAGVAVWASTVAIVARLDLAFLRLLGARDR